MRAANAAWAQHGIDTKLTDEELNVEIHLAAVCPYAPYQWEVSRDVIDAVQPQLVALDLPAAYSAVGEPVFPK